MEGEEKTILVVGAFAGGWTILPELVGQLTADMNLSVFIVLHFSKSEIGQLLVNRLQRHTVRLQNRGRWGTDSGRAYLCSMPDHHLMVKDDKILLGSGAFGKPVPPFY
jgi:chemotaxis response regulator CheB